MARLAHYPSCPPPSTSQESAIPLLKQIQCSIIHNWTFNSLHLHVSTILSTYLCAISQETLIIILQRTVTCSNVEDCKGACTEYSNYLVVKAQPVTGASHININTPALPRIIIEFLFDSCSITFSLFTHSGFKKVHILAFPVKLALAHGRDLILILIKLTNEH